LPVVGAPVRTLWLLRQGAEEDQRGPGTAVSVAFLPSTSTNDASRRHHPSAPRARRPAHWRRSKYCRRPLKRGQGDIENNDAATSSRLAAQGWSGAREWMEGGGGGRDRRPHRNRGGGIRLISGQIISKKNSAKNLAGIPPSPQLSPMAKGPSISIYLLSATAALPTGFEVSQKSPRTGAS